MPVVSYETAAWLFTVFGTGSRIQLVDLDGEAVLPIEVDIDDEAIAKARALAGGDGQKEGSNGSEALGDQVTKKKDPNALDGGAPQDSGLDASDDAGPTGTDAGVDGGKGAPDSGTTASEPKKVSVQRDAGIEDGGVGGKATDGGSPVDGGTDGGTTQPPAPTIKDPTKLAGAAASLAGNDPNVSLFLNTEIARNNAPRLAAQIGPAISKIQHWKQLFGTAGLDPIQDVDRILLAGPQFRKKADKLVAIVQMKSGQPAAKTAVDAVVKAYDGSWESTSPAIAKVTVDGTVRDFLTPGNGLILMVPDELKDNAAKLKNPSFPKSSNNEALVLRLKHPAKALKGAPFKIPDTFEWLRLSLVVKPGGVGEVVVRGTDKDAATAAENAEIVGKSIEALRTKKVAGLTITLFGPVQFQAVGNEVVGTLTLSATELTSLGEIVAGTIDDIGQK